ncbi:MULTISPECIES: hypothetical protein [unclassified Actinobaculum]|nr:MULTISPECIES: hypothetical protein [unclassified Actinobaculum]
MTSVEEVLHEVENAYNCEAPHPAVTVEGPALARNAIEQIRV